VVSYEEFAKLELKIGKIVEAEAIEESEKLLKLLVDVGEEEPRQIIAGIGKAYPDVEGLVGKEIPIVVNLEPKKLMGYMSYGMILAADSEGSPVLLHPAVGVVPGSMVK
jgi:methionine--tRNA ligase beta chain